MRSTAAITRVLPGRWRAHTRRWPQPVELGDFGRRPPSLEREEYSAYDALVRRFLRPRLTTFAGTGLILGVEDKPGWTDVLPATAEVKILRRIEPSERELRGAAIVDWVVLDRCLQSVPEMPLALGEVVGRLKPGTALITLFTGIARTERDERRPLWSVAPHAARRLHEERPDLERVTVEQYGNVTLALAWIYRLPAVDLTEQELAFVDPAYPVVVAVTASKRGGRG